jgi:Type IV secretion-system coupling protein DNA-binding domain
MPDELLHDLTPLGFYNFRNQRKIFGIKVDDRRRHIYIVGKTGTGKTTLMKNMMIADIKAGKGVAVLDPHGEFADSLVDYIPEERISDVIYFDPSDMEYPIAFNPMEQVGNEYRHLVASGIMSVFKKIWVDAWSARMEYILNNTLLSLLEFPGSTLLGVMRMFSDKEYRKQIVSKLTDPVIKSFWEDEFANYGQRLEAEALASIQNKVGQLVSNPLVRNIMGQARSALNMREIMDTGKILLVNLSKGKIGEDNSALLGAMIITRFQLAAMSRVDIKDETKRRDFFLYVDEFQNFATDSFANILSEARKYGLSLTLAHQYIGQLEEGETTRVRDAIFGNVGTIITFRVGATDAEFLEKEFMPQFLQTDLVNLGFANVYVRLMIDGEASQPFSAETLPPAVLPLTSYRDVIIKNSQDHYGTPRSVVEKKIADDWNAESADAVSDKLVRRDERGLREMLRPGAPIQRRPPSFRPQAAGSAPASGSREPMRPASVQNSGPGAAPRAAISNAAPRSASEASRPMATPASVAPPSSAPKPEPNKAAAPVSGDIAMAERFLEKREEIAEKREKKQFVRPQVDISALRQSIAKGMGSGERNATGGEINNNDGAAPKRDIRELFQKPDDTVKGADDRNG